MFTGLEKAPGRGPSQLRYLEAWGLSFQGDLPSSSFTLTVSPQAPLSHAVRHKMVVYSYHPAQGAPRVDTAVKGLSGL